MAIQPVALEQIRERLRTRRSELLVRGRRVADDLARRRDPLTADSSDQAIQLQNDEPLQAIGTATQDEIGAIDAALERMAQGLYGVCERCDGRIATARLEAVPHAVVCEDCIRN